MQGEKEVEKEVRPGEVKLDEANQEVLDYVAGEEAEADRILAEATGQEQPEKKEEASKGLNPEEKEEPAPEKKEVVETTASEAKPLDEKKEEDLTKDLTVGNAEKRISSAQNKMHESNKTAKDATQEAERLKKENEELRVLVDAKATQAPKVEDASKEVVKEESVAEPDEVEASLKALKTEYPEIADPILKVLQTSRRENQALKTRLDKLDEKETQREADAKKSVEVSHYNTIAEAHPDFEEISKEPLLDDWIGSLPAIEKVGAQAIRKNGSTSEVIELLTNFKKANGYQLPAEKTETPKANTKVEKAKKLATPSFGKAKDVNTETRQVKFTQEEIHNMSADEFKKREPEIDAALAEGLVV